MDDELRNAFATLSSQISFAGDDARAAAAHARETAVAVQGLSMKVDRLEREVFGSKPPPPLPPVAPVVKRMASQEGDLAELAGQIIAVKSELVEVKRINEEQSQKLGLDAHGWLATIRSADAKDVVRIGTLVAALATGILEALKHL